MSVTRAARLRAVVVRTWDDVWGGIKAVHDEWPWLFPVAAILLAVIL